MNYFLFLFYVYNLMDWDIILKNMESPDVSTSIDEVRRERSSLRYTFDEKDRGMERQLREAVRGSPDEMMRFSLNTLKIIEDARRKSTNIQGRISREIKRGLHWAREAYHEWADREFYEDGENTSRNRSRLIGGIKEVTLGRSWLSRGGSDSIGTPDHSRRSSISAGSTDEQRSVDERRGTSEDSRTGSLRSCIEARRDIEGSGFKLIRELPSSLTTGTSSSDLSITISGIEETKENLSTIIKSVMDRVSSKGIDTAIQASLDRGADASRNSDEPMEAEERQTLPKMSEHEVLVDGMVESTLEGQIIEEMVEGVILPASLLWESKYIRMRA